MLEDMTLGEMLQGAGMAAEGALGTGLAIATGVAGALSGGLLGTALVFGAGFLLGRRISAPHAERSRTEEAKHIRVER